MAVSQLRVATYNANSIRARLDLVLGWLEREAPDVLCLQETKVQDEEFPQDAFADARYHVVFRGQKAHAGVAIVSRAEPDRVDWGIPDGREPDEARLIRATFGSIAIVNSYVPQGRSVESEHFQYKLEWLDRIRQFFSRHYSPYDRLLWMGDFNVASEEIDVHDPKRLANHVDFHSEVRAALERVYEWGFVDVFRQHHKGEPGQYTFWDYRVRDAVDRGVGWRIDHIWATKPLAEASLRSWIDVAARRAERPSDHTFLAADFETAT
jgi:exodeoxyribonuclease-3